MSTILMIVEIIVIIVGTIVIIHQTRLSRKSIELSEKSQERLVKLETIKYVNNVIDIILEGAKWTNRSKELRQSVEEYQNLKNDNFKAFDIVQAKAKEYLTPLNGLSLAILHGAIDKDIVKEYKAPIQGIYNRFESYIKYKRAKDSEAYIEIKKMLDEL